MGETLVSVASDVELGVEQPEVAPSVTVTVDELPTVLVTIWVD